jgi:hypothetical protein
MLINFPCSSLFHLLQWNFCLVVLKKTAASSIDDEFGGPDAGKACFSCQEVMGNKEYDGASLSRDGYWYIFLLSPSVLLPAVIARM